MKYTEFTGKTVEEAVAKGLKELGLTAEQAEVRVLEEGRKKLFGWVKARVEIAEKEIEALKKLSNVKSFTLGKRILRAETASIMLPAPVVKNVDI